jgi:hypothetical protein
MTTPLISRSRRIRVRQKGSNLIQAFQKPFKTSGQITKQGLEFKPPFGTPTKGACHRPPTGGWQHAHYRTRINSPSRCSQPAKQRRLYTPVTLTRGDPAHRRGLAASRMTEPAAILRGAACWTMYVGFKAPQVAVPTPHSQEPGPSLYSAPTNAHSVQDRQSNTHHHNDYGTHMRARTSPY